MKNQTPIRPTDDDARAQARKLIHTARFGSLGVIDPETGAPFVSRIAVGVDTDGVPVSLVSELSHHTTALRRNPLCSLMIGEPGQRGDPLTHPRLTFQAKARFLRESDTGLADLRAHYLATHPKAKLYFGFSDFVFIRFVALGAFLNGGFGKAFVLKPEDLA